jgi:hypothetical protein
MRYNPVYENWTKPEIVELIRSLHRSGVDYVSILDELDRRGIQYGGMLYHFMVAFRMPLPVAQAVISWKPDMEDAQRKELNERFL